METRLRNATKEAIIGDGRPSVLAANLVLERDEYARRYIKAFRERQKTLEAES